MLLWNSKCLCFSPTRNLPFSLYHAFMELQIAERHFDFTNAVLFIPCFYGTHVINSKKIGIKFILCNLSFPKTRHNVTRQYIFLKLPLRFQLKMKLLKSFRINIRPRSESVGQLLTQQALKPHGFFKTKARIFTIRIGGNTNEMDSISFHRCTIYGKPSNC